MVELTGGSIQVNVNIVLLLMDRCGEGKRQQMSETKQQQSDPVTCQVSF